MTGPPELPETDDPFEFLGVGPGADERELRRAYVRLIRHYRPETHRVEFARIRSAYQAALTHLRIAEFLPAPDEEGEEAPPDGEGPAPDPRREALAAAWSRFAAGDREGALEAMAACRREHPDRAPTWAHSFLLEDALGRPFEEAAEHLLEGLRRRAGLASWILAALAHREVAALADRPELAWSGLRGQPDRPAAAGLFRSRVHTRLVAGDLDSVLAEVESAEFAEDAFDDPALAWIAREVMVVAAWERTSAAERLRESFSTGEAETGAWCPEDSYEEVRRIAPAFARWRARLPEFPALARFLHVAPVADGANLFILVADLLADFLERPRAWSGAFETMAEEDRGLLLWYLALAGNIAPDNRGLEDEEAIAALDDLLLQADHRTRSVRTDRAKVYREHLRGPLLRLCAGKPVSPFHAAAFVERDPHRYPMLRGLAPLIMEDATLAAMAATRRLGEPPAPEEDAEEEPAAN